MIKDKLLKIGQKQQERKMIKGAKVERNSAQRNKDENYSRIPTRNSVN